MSPVAHPAQLPPLPDDERVLLLLGLLTYQDRHGYEINDFIEHQLHCVTDLKKATAYQLLERLEQHGLVVSHLEQHGNRPNRKVYGLTEQGHARFLRLLGQQLREEEALILPGNIPVIFCEHLSPAEQSQALSERLSKLQQRLEIYAAVLAKVELSSGVGLAMQRVQVLTLADAEWTRQLLERLALGGA